MGHPKVSFTSKPARAPGADLANFHSYSSWTATSMFKSFTSTGCKELVRICMPPQPQQLSGRTTYARDDMPRYGVQHLPASWCFDGLVLFSPLGKPGSTYWRITRLIKVDECAENDKVT